MYRKTLDKNSDISCLEISEEFNKKGVTKWDSNSSNEEAIFDSQSEILCFSDLTERTTSSCSWHNDDFDMNSRVKVKESLEAIEDALYEKKQSHLLSNTVFQECCEWTEKFSYIRLKGQQLINPTDDNAFFTSVEENEKNSDYSSSGLQIHGKKMAIHVPEKLFNKSYDNIFDDGDGEPNYFKEDLGRIDELEEGFALDTRNTCCKSSETDVLKNEIQTTVSIEVFQEKVLERLVLEMWPKVLTVLQNADKTLVLNDFEDFQLPPIVAAVQQRKILHRRPKTEGTDSLTNDVPKLSSILTISPKILQNKQYYGNRRGTATSSRPNSEIHLSHRNFTVPAPRRKHFVSKVSNKDSQLSNFKQIHLACTKPIIQEEKEHSNTSSQLPALEEDFPESSNVLKGISLEPEVNEILSTKCEKIHFSKKSESFLPPIENKNSVPANVKLTQNLFTFFGSPLKFDKHEGNVTTIRPTSRPYTGISRKAAKFSGNLSNKLDGNSSWNNAKKEDHVNSDNQVTLFPIVTSLPTDKEKKLHSDKKGLLNKFASGKKR
ncbi:hypothetical protein CDAR_200911 [Caerostris darwini]|uniref:DUF3719 domain-containing protein n=1 Tax=Caerostris darwini TaxID=1538125 RepID=A0AAV4S864_9ARAC|nr:hypothetical protein CDAR_200911 [Caerostris darwini]